MNGWQLLRRERALVIRKRNRDQWDTILMQLRAQLFAATEEPIKESLRVQIGVADRKYHCARRDVERLEAKLGRRVA